MEPSKRQDAPLRPPNNLPDAPSTPMTTMDMFLGPPAEAVSQPHDTSTPPPPPPNKPERPSRKILRLFGRSPTKKTSPSKNPSILPAQPANDLPIRTTLDSPSASRYAMTLRDTRAAPALAGFQGIVRRPTIVTANMMDMVPMTAAIVEPAEPVLTVDHDVEESDAQGKTLGELAGRLERVEAPVIANRDLLVEIGKKLSYLMAHPWES